MNRTSNAGLKVPFGKRGDKLVAPTEVQEIGLACACICPGCAVQLMIRQGKKRRHFAHYNAYGSERCVEQSIHAAAIQVLLEHRWLRVPAMMVVERKKAKSGKLVERSHELSPSRVIRFDQCKPEVTLNDLDKGVIRPDVIGYRAERQMLVEMCFTHAVDAEKMVKVANYGYPTIESHLFDLDLDHEFEAVRQRVLEEVAYKDWLYYPNQAQVREQLRAEIDAEIQALDRIHERQLVNARSKQQAEEARLEKQRLTRDEARQHRQATAAAEHRAYQQRSVHEKEQEIRQKLGIKGSWPNYLRFFNPNNRAIDAPHRLWQAAVFHQFIFQKPRLSTTVEVAKVIRWVIDWFGETPGTDPDAAKAVRAFLSYLKGCGFIQRPSVTLDVEIYIVLHIELAPPVRRAAIRFSDHGTGQTIEALLPTGSSGCSIKHFGDSTRWKKDWPSYEDAYASATKWVSMSRKDELKILTILYENRQNLPAPFHFAMAMRDHDIPLSVTFNFLKETGLLE